MSVKLMSKAWDMDLPSGQKFVLLALCDHANDDGLCYPGQSRLADKCGMSPRTVSSHIDWLEKRGLIRKERRQNTQRRKSDLYHISLDGSAHANSAHAEFSREHANFAGSYKEEPSETFNRQIEPSGYCTAPQTAADTPSCGFASEPAPRSDFADNGFDRPSETPPETPPAQSAKPAKRKPSAARREPDALNLLADRGVDGALAQDYLAVRRDKRSATLTKTALAGLEREANRAGLSLAQAVTLCCERGWVDFRADWLHDRHTRERAAGNGHTSHFFGNEYFENADYGDEIGEIP